MQDKLKQIDEVLLKHNRKLSSLDRTVVELVKDTATVVEVFRTLNSLRSLSKWLGGFATLAAVIPWLLEHYPEILKLF